MTLQMADLFTDCERSLASTGTAQLDALRGGSLFVTGGSGFAGSWLAVLTAYLNDRHSFGLKLTLLARSRGRLDRNLPTLMARGDIAFQQGDIRQLVELPAETNWIVHAAASPDSRQHATNPIETASVIADGTSRLMRMAEPLVTLNRILHFSSGLVYGGASGAQPLAEDELGVVCRLDASNVYVESKRYSEALCAAYRTQARLPVTVTRPFTFIGPFQELDAPWAANNFIQAALRGQPIKIIGSGETTRTYLYGSDMAALALHHLVASQPGETFNLGGTTPISVRALAELVSAKAPRRSEIRVGNRAFDAAYLIPDMGRSKRQFGFVPAFSTEDAVARTITWHQSPSRTAQQRA